MNATLHRTRTLTATATAVALLALAVPGVAAGDDTGNGSVRCHWSVSQLPRTPDAAEGWYRGCPAPGVPHSPAGVDGWTR